MKLTAQEVKEFKLIYEQDYRETITDNEAEEMARRVALLYELLSQLLPDEKQPIEGGTSTQVDEEK